MSEIEALAVVCFVCCCENCCEFGGVGGASSYRYNVAMNDSDGEAQLVARWTDRTPLVAVRRRIVAYVTAPTLRLAFEFRSLLTLRIGAD